MSEQKNIDSGQTQNDVVIALRESLNRPLCFTATLFLLTVSGLLVFRLAHLGSGRLIMLPSCAIVLLIFLLVPIKRANFQIAVFGILLVWLIVSTLEFFILGLSGMGLLWFIGLGFFLGSVIEDRLVAPALGLFCFYLLLLGCLYIFIPRIHFTPNNSHFFQVLSWINTGVTVVFFTILFLLYRTTLDVSLPRLVNDMTQQSDEMETTLNFLETKLEKHEQTVQQIKQIEKEKEIIANGLETTRIFVIGHDLSVIWANRIAMDDLNIHAPDCRYDQLFKNWEAPGPHGLVMHSIETGENVSNQLSDSKGDLHSIQSHPITNAEGDVVRVILFVTDMSDKSKLQKELKTVKSRLEARINQNTQELEASNKALENAVIQSNKLANEAVIRNNRLEAEIKKRRQTQTALKHSEERYRTIIERIDEGYCELDTLGRFLYFNQALCDLTGYSPRELESREGISMIAENFQKDVIARYKDVFNSGENQREVYFDIIRKDGSPLKVEASVSIRKDSNDKIMGFRGIVRDVDKRKKYEEQLLYQAYHDPLTGLGNRKAFYERIADSLNQAKRNTHEIALIFIDIDRFKEVNDTLGHEAGDILLKSIAHRLTGALRKTDYTFRLGGDEFTIIITQSESVQLDVLARKIIHCISQPYDLESSIVNYVSASLGISKYPNDGGHTDILVKNADLAMYEAKKERNRFIFFEAL